SFIITGENLPVICRVPEICRFCEVIPESRQRQPRPNPKVAVTPRTRSVTTTSSGIWKRDFHDLIAEGAPRDLDDSGIAQLLAQRGLAARAGGEDLVVVVILLTRADQLVGRLRAGVEVLDADPGPEDDGVAGQTAAIDDVSPAQPVLEHVDPGL